MRRVAFDDVSGDKSRPCSSRACLSPYVVCACPFGEAVVRAPTPDGRLVCMSHEPALHRDNSEAVSGYMDGRFNCLVFTEAGGTGASYHAADWCESSGRRRMHFLLETSFSPTSAVQQAGRSHRSAQKTAPVRDSSTAVDHAL